MIDTIKGYKDLSEYDLCYSDFQHLSEIKSDENGNVSLQLQNFKITIKFQKGKAITIRFNGSLPKLFYGNNLAQIDWDNLTNAIDFLSDNLGFDISDATLTRVDFGINIILSKPIEQYLVCLISYPRKNHLEYKSSKKFFSGTSAVLFYDKIKEIKSRQKESIFQIPEILQRQQILRYEIQLKTPLNKIVNKDKFIFSDLLIKENQKKIQNKWIEMFEKTEKINITISYESLLKQRNGIVKFLAIEGISKIGTKNIYKMIDSLKLDVKNISSKKSKMKGIIRDLINEANELSNDNLLDEVRDKISYTKELFFVK